jgi:hypothetical protein
LNLKTGPKSGYTFRIRDRKIRCRPMAPAELAEVRREIELMSTVLVVPLKYAKAEAVAEVVSRTIREQLPDASIVADSQANTIVIKAPRDKHAAISKAVIAIDGLYKK